MADISRRTFIGGAAAVTGAAAIAASSPTGAGASPLNHLTGGRRGRHRHGDIRDIEHVVIVMQENRSFDHYFGTMKGVRGFGDRSTTILPGGLPVWQQPTTSPFTLAGPDTPTQFPWQLSAEPAADYPADNRPPDSRTGAQGYGGTAHGWTDQHAAWYGGWMNGWCFAKGGPTTLGYLTRDDIPWHYALADHYTVGDAYHCSVLSSTGPNRTFLWSGTIDAAKKHSDYSAIMGGDELGKFLLWQSYAETLQAAGVSWRAYQCIDDYGDNGLEYFKTFARYDPAQGGTAAPGNVLYDNGVKAVDEPHTGLRANADNLADAVRADVLAGRLPQVSWVISNQAFSEHPSGAPNDGAYLLDALLRALNADPDVFNSTLVIVNYDENDGQFDHVPPPVPAPGEYDEFNDEDPILVAVGLTEPVPVGLGFRVPLVLVSPWTRGGWVTSEVSDHTSVIQLLERWTAALGKPALCPNISPWRRRVCGDLTSAFDFRSPVYGLPTLPPTTVIGNPPHGSYAPEPVTNAMPAQEPGRKRARPVPCQPNANLDGFSFGADGQISARLSFSNRGPHVTRASHFAVYNNAAPEVALARYPEAFPGQFTVDRTHGSDVVPGSVEIGAGHGDGVYDLTIIGPNRFHRRFTGDTSAPGATASAQLLTDEVGFARRPHLRLRLANRGTAPVTFTVATDHGLGRRRSYRVAPSRSVVHLIDPLLRSHGWYDVTVSIDTDPSWTRRYIGHLENGRASVTGI